MDFKARAREWAKTVGFEPEHETEEDRQGIAALAELLRAVYEEGGNDAREAARPLYAEASLFIQVRGVEDLMDQAMPALVKETVSYGRHLRSLCSDSHDPVGNEFPTTCRRCGRKLGGIGA